MASAAGNQRLARRSVSVREAWAVPSASTPPYAVASAPSAGRPGRRGAAAAVAAAATAAATRSGAARWRGRSDRGCLRATAALPLP